MTVQNITVTANYCFGDSPLQLQGLGKVNFIFAPNGSGKTTVSSALASQPIDPQTRMHWAIAPTELLIRVFNEKYRSQVLTERVDGIFTMGDASRIVNDQVDEIVSRKRGRTGERASWKNEIGVEGDEKGAGTLFGEISRETLIARNVIFDAHRSLDKSVVEVVFKGFRSDRAKFWSESLRRSESDHSVPEGVTWESLETRVTSLKGDKTPRALLPNVTVVTVISEEQLAELSESGSSVGNGEFAKLIQKLANEDWVSNGRTYVGEAEGACPFCQQDLPHDFEQRIAEYFAGGFDVRLRRAGEIQEVVQARVTKLRNELTALESTLSDNEADGDKAIAQTIGGVRTAVDLLLAQLEKKCAHPTRAIEAQDVYKLASQLVKLVDERNQELAAYNTLVANVKREGAAVVADGWALFLNDATVKNAIRRFVNIKKKKDQRISELHKSIADSETADRKDDGAVDELRRSISNTSEVADRINRLLQSMGFYRFHLAIEDAVVGGYRIVRTDGSFAFESLSEGEKSFLCFAYFWESLFGSSASGGSPEDVIAVIDDPISSLDSDTLFIVAAHIRHAASIVVDDVSNLRQLIVLTHNTQFHHEAAYAVDRAKKEERHFYRLIKGVDGFTTVADDENVSKIRGTYPLLWDSVVEAARNKDESALVQVGVFNIVRRIIEGYFKTIGKVSDYQRPVGIVPTDERLVSMFHMWASSGSHTIADDLDQTIDVGGTKNFLKLFRRYFDLVGHDAHFDMMLRASGGDDLASTGEVFASSMIAKTVSVSPVESTR